MMSENPQNKFPKFLTLMLLALVMSSLILGGCSKGTKANEAQSAPIIERDHREKPVEKKNDLSGLAIHVPENKDTSLLQSLDNIPAGKYFLMKVQTNLFLEKFKAYYVFEQILKTPGKFANEDQIRGGRVGEMSSNLLAEGESLWPIVYVNIPLSLESKDELAIFQNVHFHGNQWFSENRGRYKWWSRGDENSYYPSISKFFSEGTQPEGMRYFVSASGKTIEEGLASARLSNDIVEVWVCYKSPIVAIMSKEKNETAESQVIFYLTYKRSTTLE